MSYQYIFKQQSQIIIIIIIVIKIQSLSKLNTFNLSLVKYQLLITRWECLLVQCGVGCFSLGSWFFISSTPFLLNLEGIYNWKNWLLTWFIGSATTAVFWAGTMGIWVYGLNLRYPAPMIGLWSTGWGLFAQVRWQYIFKITEHCTLPLILKPSSKRLYINDVITY